MKIRTLLAVLLGSVFMSGMSLAQESALPESTSEEPLLGESLSPEPLQGESTSQRVSSVDPRSGRRTSRSRSSSDEMVMKIFVLRYYPVDELGILIENIFSIDGEKIHADRSTNRLILQATKEQMTDIETLITELDVAASELESSQALEDLVYRVFMFEIPSENQNLKSFSMIIQTPAVMPSKDILHMARTYKIQVSDFLIVDERDSENDILIQGKAPSNDSIIQMMQAIDPSRIKELQWDDDETFTSRIEAAHFSRLPGQILTHIQKFLGEDIVTVGYWFGSSSVPGEIEAPIGPWRLHLELSPESDRTLELRVEVEVPEERSRFDRQLGRERSDEILSNTILAKIGKPVIVGYNRSSYGTRRMGAMVILPEVDTIGLEGN